MKIHNLNAPKQRFIPDISAGAFLVMSVLILFLPVFLGWRGIFQNDQVIAEFSRHVFLARTLQSGMLPLWQPDIWCGAIPYYSFPYGGDSYYFLLWPFYLLSDLNNLDSAYWTISILPLALHYLIAAFGMYVLLRQVVGCGRFAACLGAFAYIYSPAFAYSYVCLYSLIMQAWLPWLIWIHIMTVRDFRIWKLFLGVMIFAFIWLGSKLQYVPFVIIIWLGFILMSVLERSRHGNLKDISKPLFVAVLIFIFGTLLSAPYLYSFLDGLRHTSLGFTPNFNTAIADHAANLSPAYLATLFVPDLFGSITGKNFVFDRLMFFYANMSGGTAVTFTVLIGALFSFGWFLKDKRRCSLQNYAILGIVLYIFAVLCALGGNTPFYKMAIGWIPVVGGLPNPIRFRFIQCFATSLLIAIGLHYLIRSEILTRSFRLRKFLWLYAIFSACVIGVVLFLPHDASPADISAESSSFKTEGYFPLGQPVGVYTPRMSRTKKIKVMFDGESGGEIRFSDNHAVSPERGNLVRGYHVLNSGLVEFDVDIPPNSFVWVYPKSGPGRIGYRHAKPGWGCFRYDRSWVINSDTDAVSLFQDTAYQNAPLFIRMKNSYLSGANPLSKPLLFWLLTLSVMFAGAYFFPLKRFGYFLGVFILIEFLIFGFMAFYGCTFNEDTSRFREFLPHNVRAARPSAHPMTQLMMKKLPLVVPDDPLRIATDYPFCENYSYLNGKFSFMGEPAYPLEKRFKRAIEAAYGENMRPCIFYNAEKWFPKKPRFLCNFSVGYFLSRDPRQIFADESVVPLTYDNADYFAHINQGVLPRAYMMDTFIPASDDRQLEELLSGDLRRAVYMDRVDGWRSGEEDVKDYVARFNDLQSMNPVTYVNYDDPNQMEVDVAVDKPSMLVLAEVWYPGWEATVDGRHVPIRRVNYCQRGIWLGKGAHRVILRFSPLAWRIGVGISLGVIIVLIFLFLSRRRIETWMRDP